jgi:hypothetical protein
MTDVHRGSEGSGQVRCGVADAVLQAVICFFVVGWPCFATRRAGGGRACNLFRGDLSCGLW